MSKVAFIGLGNMGEPMATNLLKAGHEVDGFDISQVAKERFAKKGGKTSESISEMVRDANVVVTMLPAGEHVKSVYLEPDGVLQNCGADAVLIDSSTIDVETSRLVAKEAGQLGRAIIDAPVSGGVVGAEAGTLTFMVGGTEQAFEAAKPFLEIMGKTIVHAGGPGNGQAAKICNNLILGISMVGVCEGFLLAEKLGLDHQKLFDISSKSSGQCWALTTYCPVPGPVPTSPANNDYKAGFSAAMMLKDLKLAQESATTTDSISPLGSQASALFDLFCKHCDGDIDFSALIKYMRGENLK